MTYPIGFFQTQKPDLKQKQSQVLMMMPKMQQAIRLLQAPAMELTILIQNELEHNPVLEEGLEASEEMEEDLRHDEPDQETDNEEVTFDDDNFEIMKRLDEEYRDHFAESGNYNNIRSAEEAKKRSFLETTIQESESLFSHLMKQANDSFESEEERLIAEDIIGNLNENGFLTGSIEELSVMSGRKEEDIEKILEVIQTFDPVGVGAKNLQESLLIQLRAKDKQDTLAYRLLEEHYDDVIHSRIPAIAKKTGWSAIEIEQSLKEDISHLDLRPGAWFSQTTIPYPTPDVSIFEEGEVLLVNINGETIPTLRLNRRYLKMLDQPGLNEEEKKYVKNNVASAQWLIRNIDQRNSTLRGIAEYIIEKQSEFLRSSSGNLKPMIMKEIADRLDVHESTIARAVAEKYIQTPRGLFPMRFFFTGSYTTQGGRELSTRTVKDILQDLIRNEDKHKPFSDEVLSTMLKKRGIPCARRTVAKYRKVLNIPTARVRKEYS